MNTSTRLALAVAVAVSALAPAVAQEPLATTLAAPPATPLDRALRGQPPAPPDPGAAIRAGNWPQAMEAARRLGDPLAVDLVTFARLLTANAADATEIAAFAAAHPDWPAPSLLERRRQEALARTTDPAVLATECPRTPLTVPAALLRCAEALPGTPELARRAWIGGGIVDLPAETAFLARFGQALTVSDQLARFEAVIGNLAAATRQATRLEPGPRAVAEARLALRRKDAAAPALLTGLSEAARNDPALFLDQAVYLRETGQDDAALALWRARGEGAQAGMPVDQRGKFWTERHRFARQLLRQGDAAGAYDLAALPGMLPSDAQLDAQFLAGFIALRKLANPARARIHFQALAAASPAALTQSRAWYWLGRVEAAGGSDPAPAYAKAAAWPLTFYGQLAVLALGESEGQLAARIRATGDPPVPDGLTTELAGREGVHAAKMLLGWGETRRAGAFFARMDELAASPAERVALARIALGMKLADAAVLDARRLGRDGVVLGQSGWPSPVHPPAGPIPPAVTLALIRQESNFDISIVSPAGARGLMQLLPATAQAVAKRMGQTVTPAALTNDGMLNMRLGTSYLGDMLERFSTLPLAVAAYNAGPHRVTAWLVANGDPRPNVRAAGDGAAPMEVAVDLIDWIELIPFNETRNYVQRVLEGVAVYRARGAEDVPELLAEWKPRR